MPLASRHSRSHRRGTPWLIVSVGGWMVAVVGMLACEQALGLDGLLFDVGTTTTTTGGAGGAGGHPDGGGGGGGQGGTAGQGGEGAAAGAGGGLGGAGGQGGSGGTPAAGGSGGSGLTGPELECWQQYGSLNGYEICVATSTVCEFYVELDQHSCDAVCGLHGGTCLTVYVDASPTNLCLRGGTLGCADDNWQSVICRCTND